MEGVYCHGLVETRLTRTDPSLSSGNFVLAPPHLSLSADLFCLRPRGDRPPWQFSGELAGPPANSTLPPPNTRGI
jgi:hypothetical protein